MHPSSPGKSQIPGYACAECFDSGCRCKSFEECKAYTLTYRDYSGEREWSVEVQSVLPRMRPGVGASSSPFWLKYDLPQVQDIFVRHSGKRGHSYYCLRIQETARGNTIEYCCAVCAVHLSRPDGPRVLDLLRNQEEPDKWTVLRLGDTCLFVRLFSFVF